MTITVNGAQVVFQNGALVLAYFNVSFSAGAFPNSLNGSLQITADQGVTISSTQEEIITVAEGVIKTIIAENPNATTIDTAPKEAE